MKTEETKSTTENNPVRTDLASGTRAGIDIASANYTIGQQIQLLQSGRLAPVQLQATMLNLQRTIGNRAVVQLMSRQQNNASNEQKFDRQLPQQDEAKAASDKPDISQVRSYDELLQAQIQLMRRNKLQNVQPIQKADINKNTESISENSHPDTSLSSTNTTGMPAQLKSGIETLSGVAMNDVKVHYNSDKPVQLKAFAYTQGNDIHVGPGQEKHLPHEAWHVVQQKQGKVEPTIQMKGDVLVNDDKGLEKEADIMGEKALKIGANAGADGDTPSAANSVNNHTNVIQRMGYEDLDHVQRVQVDAIAENVYHKKAYEFEGALAQVANNRTQARDTVQILHYNFIGKQPVQQDGTSSAQVRRFLGHLGDNVNNYDFKHINKTRRERSRQTKDIKPRLTMGGDPVVKRHIHEEVQPDPQVRGREKLVNFPGNKPRIDSKYARKARDQRQRVVSGASKLVAVLLKIAEDLGASQDQKRELRLAAIATNTPDHESFYEIILGAKPWLATTHQGPKLYREIDPPLTNSSVGKLYPDHFLSPAFLIELAHFVFNTTPQERTDAEARMPHDVVLTLTALVQTLHNNNELLRRHDPDLDQYLPRSLYDVLNQAQFDFVKNTLIGQRGNILLEMQNDLNTAYDKYYQQAIGVHIAEGSATFIMHFIFGDKIEEINTVQSSPRIAGSSLFLPHQVGKRPGKPTDQETGNPSVTLNNYIDTTSGFLGKYDRNVNIDRLKKRSKRLVTSYPQGAYGINLYIAGAYTKMDSVMAEPHDPKDTGNRLSSDAHRKFSKRALAATYALEDPNLHVYKGTTYRGVPGRVDANQIAINEELSKHTPGTIISDGVLWSTSKTIRDIPGGFKLGNNRIVYVIDDIATGKDVQLFANYYWHQREVLFPPYARFVITRVENTLNLTGTGDMFVFMREVTPQQDNHRTLQSQQEFQTYKDERITARTYVDKNDFDEGETAYLTEQPVSDELGGLSNSPHGSIIEPNLLYGHEGLKAWTDSTHDTNPLPGRYVVTANHNMELTDTERDKLRADGFTVSGITHIRIKMGAMDPGVTRQINNSYKVTGNNILTVLTRTLLSKMQRCGLNIQTESPKNVARNGISLEFLRQIHVNLSQHDPNLSPGTIRSDGREWGDPRQEGYDLNLNQIIELRRKGLIVNEIIELGKYNIQANGNYTEDGINRATNNGANINITTLVLCRDLLGFTAIALNHPHPANTFHIQGAYNGDLYLQNALALVESGLLTHRNQTANGKYKVAYPYTTQHEIIQALTNYITWYNQQLQDIYLMPTDTDINTEAKRKAMVRHATEAQQKLVAIHPFVDANGRLSRFMLYLTLKIHFQGRREQLEPIIPDPDADLTTSYEDWAQQIDTQIQQNGGH